MADDPTRDEPLALGDHEPCPYLALPVEGSIGPAWLCPKCGWSARRAAYTPRADDPTRALRDLIARVLLVANELDRLDPEWPADEFVSDLRALAARADTLQSERDELRFQGEQMAKALVEAGEARRAAEARVAALTATLRAVLALLDECWFDHSGNCQEHLLFSGEPCPVGAARAVLADATNPDTAT